MQITCPHCQYAKDVNQQWIPANPSQVDCPKCQGVFYFSQDGGVSLQRPAPPVARLTCPACGLEQPEGRSCVSCSVVFATFGQEQRAAAEATEEFSFEAESVQDPVSELRQNVETQPKGGFWIRVVALLLDSLFYSLIIAAITFATVMLKGGDLMQMAMMAQPGQMSDAQIQDMAAQMGMLNLALTGVALLVFILYFVMPIARSGKTIGKKICGVRVIRKDGAPLGVGRALLREIIGKWLSSLILGIGYLMVAFSKQKQGLHDIIAGTYVIKSR